MQQIAPRTSMEQGRQQQRAQAQQQQQHHHQQQQQQQQHHHHQHPYQLHHPPQPQPETQFQVQVPTAQAQLQAPRAQAQASDQGHAVSDRTSQMLRDPMDTSPTHYSPADVMQHTSTSSPTEPHSAESMPAQGNSPEETSLDGRKGYGKRELSTSKRAAQNRAAQRAFRQRKEGYIKKLEEQVREYGVLSEQFKAIQQENYQLRDYIIALQSRLLEAQGEVPPPPGGLDGLQPGAKQGLGHQQGSTQLSGTATLPRLSELGAIQSQPPPQPIQPQLYDSKITSAQAALQGPSILHSPTGR